MVDDVNPESAPTAGPQSGAAPSTGAQQRPMEPGTDAEKDYVGQLSCREDALEIYETVYDGFKAKQKRDDATKNYWDVYNCELTDRQSYSGTSQIFVPVVHDAIEARTLRFSNTLFPKNGQFVDCISSTADNNHANKALVNHYVRGAKLREIVSSMLRSGDVTGQYSLYMGWRKKVRTVTQRATTPVMVEGMDTGETAETVEEVKLEQGAPDIWVIPDEDLCVLPATVDDIEDADTVAVALRVTKAWLRERKDQFTAKKYKEAKGLFGHQSEDPTRANPEKQRTKDAGVKSEKGSKHLLLYEIWTTMELGGERVPAVILCAGPTCVLSIKKNPYWGQRCPVISAPIKKVPGSFWGVSPSKSVEKLQYQCNDAINMGMDSAQFALMPIVMTDPQSNPRIGTMVLAMAAVWETNPNNTQLVKFPALWQDALGIVSATKAQIHESLGLNPAMMPSGAGSRKPTQAQVAQEQTLAIEGTSDAVSTIEESILTPVAQRIFEYDQQYRDEPMLISHFGELGYEALQEKIPPVQFGTRYAFSWNGTAVSQSAQHIQQMISTMNVLRGIPPQQLAGRQLDVGPVLDSIVDVVFGPRLGPRVLKDVRSKLSVDPQIENEMLMANMPAMLSPLDDDAQHIQVHHQAGMQTGDPTHQIAAHIYLHQQQMAAKAQAAAPQPGQPGIPGGNRPGVPGAPRIGAQPRGPRGAVQQPPGAVHPDQMQDPGMMPRK